MVRGEIEESVNEASKPTADKRSQPVDPVARVVAADDGRTEGPSRVHGSSGEWACGQDIGSDDETNGDGRHSSDGTLLGVNCGGVDCVDEAEGDDDLKNHALQSSNA